VKGITEINLGYLLLIEEAVEYRADEGNGEFVFDSTGI
jgi:hypothetical protein